MSALSTVIGRGTNGSRPAAGNPGRLYYDTTNSQLQRDNGSSWDVVEPTTLSDPMTTRGDIIVRNSSNATARLAVGAAGKVLRSDGTDLSYQYPPGYEFDYVERTTNATITGTAEGSETTVLTGNSVSYDGSTTIMVQFFAPRADYAGDGSALVVMLYDGATVLGRLTTPIAVDQSGASLSGWGAQALNGWRRLTPSNASHQYIVKAWRNVADVTIDAGAGGSGTDVPAFLRVTKV